MISRERSVLRPSKMMIRSAKSSSCLRKSDPLFHLPDGFGKRFHRQGGPGPVSFGRPEEILRERLVPQAPELRERAVLQTLGQVAPHRDCQGRPVGFEGGIPDHTAPDIEVNYQEGAGAWISRLPAYIEVRRSASGRAQWLLRDCADCAPEGCCRQVRANLFPEG